MTAEINATNAVEQIYFNNPRAGMRPNGIRIDQDATSQWNATVKYEFV